MIPGNPYQLTIEKIERKEPNGSTSSYYKLYITSPWKLLYIVEKSLNSKINLTTYDPYSQNNSHYTTKDWSDKPIETVVDGLQRLWVDGRYTFEFRFFTIPELITRRINYNGARRILTFEKSLHKKPTQIPTDGIEFGSYQLKIDGGTFLKKHYSYRTFSKEANSWLQKVVGKDGFMKR